MARFVWEVRATGGDPAAITGAVASSLIRLRERDTVADEDTADAWAQDVIAASVIDTATAGDATSVLVEVETRDQDAPRIAARLSGGFDDEVLDAVIELRGVTTVTHSDRIPRA